MESFSRAVKRRLHHMEVRRVPVRRLVATGGRAHSNMWRQIVSNIIQMPQHHLRRGEAPLVAAFLGGYRLRSVHNLDEVQSCVTIESAAEPRVDVRASNAGPLEQLSASVRQSGAYSGPRPSGAGAR